MVFSNLWSDWGAKGVDHVMPLFELALVVLPLLFGLLGWSVVEALLPSIAALVAASGLAQVGDTHRVLNMALEALFSWAPLLVVGYGVGRCVRFGAAFLYKQGSRVRQ